ncbi:MAG TPA: flavoprotein, partial [Ginsengibacter sp.]|nr:flavoprotein [Ginsengibacter sp.]
MKKIVIAITGASGSIYSKLLLDKLEKLRGQWDEVSVVITENAKQVWKTELGDSEYQKKSFKNFSVSDFTAPFASGSGQYGTMIIIPCSMGT